MTIKRKEERYNLSESRCSVVVAGSSGTSAGTLPKLACLQGSNDIVHLILPLAESSLLQHDAILPLINL
jgi:hypothetical protein